MEQGSESMIVITFFITPIIIFIVGLWMKNRPPKEINRFNGYRTKRSMSSQGAWDFAQTYSAGIMIRMTLPMLLVGAAGAAFMEDVKGISQATYMVLVMVAQTVCLLAVYPLTESQLKRLFGKDEDK